jgi:50S ribosomal protein L16 3-hydroxylase
MSRHLGDIDVDEFLDRYWQREPCLLRGVLDGYDFPLDGDDLAGLACEPLAESRLIEGPDPDGGWALRHGPFEESDFDALGDACWTLLVQDVEKHYPPLATLLERFDFLPRWRFDDLMLSFAAPGGSVGPHVDQYDVFLVQVSGRRQWSIARAFQDERRENVPIDMLERFEAEKAWTLEPGDALYLPPNVAHHGVAVDPCLTCSVGFRAPSAADLAMGLGEWLARRPNEGGRYADPPLSARHEPGKIDDEALEAFAALLKSGIDERSGFNEFIGAFLSHYRLAQEPVANPAGVDSKQALRDLEAGGLVRLHPWARLTWIRQETPPGARLFASGAGYCCSSALALWLCNGAVGSTPAPLAAADRECLLRLIQAGILLVPESA